MPNRKITDGYCAVLLCESAKHPTQCLNQTALHYKEGGKTNGSQGKNQNPSEEL